jgi:hypothetical protein
VAVAALAPIYTIRLWVPVLQRGDPDAIKVNYLMTTGTISNCCIMDL